MNYRLLFLIVLSTWMSGCTLTPLLYLDYWKEPEYADVYIQAGHEGRKNGKTGASSNWGKEIEWTKIVADEATRILRGADISVVRSNADRRRRSKVKLAISIHFDGNDIPCSTGASIGYDDDTDKPAADAWRSLYKEYFPFKWHEDNFVENLSDYYNFRYTITTDAELLLEMGEISCKEQAEWLKTRLKGLGSIIAYFSAVRVGNMSVAKPKL